MSAPTDSCSLPGILCECVLYSGCLAEKLRNIGQFAMAFSMFVFILMDLHTNSLVFSISLWLTCSSSSTFSCRDDGTVILLPLIMVLSVPAISSLNDQYHTSHNSTGHLCLSSRFSSHISSSLMHSEMSVHVSIAFMFMHIPGISSSLWCYGYVLIAKLLWIAVELAFTESLLYWWRHGSILCSLCHRFAVLFEDGHQWSVIMLTLWAKH